MQDGPFQLGGYSDPSCKLDDSGQLEDDTDQSVGSAWQLFKVERLLGRPGGDEGNEFVQDIEDMFYGAQTRW